MIWGKSVIHAEDLTEISQVYHGITGKAKEDGNSPRRRERTRDICKVLKTGETLRILALENQQMIDYAIPFRCMQYDIMEWKFGTVPERLET